MQGYGPLIVTPGAVIGQPVNPAADRILVSNRSVYDVLVSFQSGEPLSDVQCSPAWPVVVHAGDLIVYTLRNADKTPTPLGSYWSGQVWLCAIDTSRNLALNGVISSSAQMWLTALAPGDPTPSIAARPTSVDASSQSRIINIPALAQYTYTTAFVATAGTTPIYQRIAPTDGGTSAVGNEGIIAAIWYLHNFQLSLDAAGVRVGFRLFGILLKPGQSYAAALLTSSQYQLFYQGYLLEPNRSDWLFPAPRQGQGWSSPVVAGLYLNQMIIVVDYLSASTGMYITTDSTRYTALGINNFVPPAPIGDGVHSTSLAWGINAQPY